VPKLPPGAKYGSELVHRTRQFDHVALGLYETGHGANVHRGFFEGTVGYVYPRLTDARQAMSPSHLKAVIRVDDGYALVDVKSHGSTGNYDRYLWTQPGIEIVSDYGMDFSVGTNGRLQEVAQNPEVQHENKLEQEYHGLLGRTIAETDLDSTAHAGFETRTKFTTENSGWNSFVGTLPQARHWVEDHPYVCDWAIVRLSDGFGVVDVDTHGLTTTGHNDPKFHPGGVRINALRQGDNKALNDAVVAMRLEWKWYVPVDGYWVRENPHGKELQ
jgi:hypothetical protein